MNGIYGWAATGLQDTSWAVNENVAKIGAKGEQKTEALLKFFFGVGMGNIAIISALSPSLDVTSLGIPISPVSVPAGFPSPVQVYFKGRIDLN